MGDPLRALYARSSGHFGMWERLRREDGAYGPDEDEYPDAAPAPTWWLRLRGRMIRWSLAAAVFVAYVNHWPGGH